MKQLLGTSYKVQRNEWFRLMHQKIYPPTHLQRLCSVRAVLTQRGISCCLLWKWGPWCSLWKDFEDSLGICGSHFWEQLSKTMESQTLKTRTQKALTGLPSSAVPGYLRGTGSRTPADTKILGCSRPFYKTVWYSHVTYPQLPVHTKSSLDYL